MFVTPGSRHFILGQVNLCADLIGILLAKRLTHVRPTREQFDPRRDPQATKWAEHASLYGRRTLSIELADQLEIL